MSESKQMELNFLLAFAKRFCGNKYDDISNNLTGYLFRLSLWLLIPPVVIEVLDWLSPILPIIPYFSLIKVIGKLSANLSMFLIATIIFGAVIKSAEFSSIFSEIISQKMSVINPSLTRGTENLEDTLNKALTNPEILCKIPTPQSAWEYLTKEEIKKRFGSVPDLNARLQLVADKILHTNVIWERPYIFEELRFKYKINRCQDNVKSYIEIKEEVEAKIFTDETTSKPYYTFEWEFDEDSGTQVLNPTWDILVRAPDSLQMVSLLGDSGPYPVTETPAEITSSGKKLYKYIGKEDLRPQERYSVFRNATINIYQGSGPYWYFRAKTLAMNVSIEINTSDNIQVEFQTMGEDRLFDKPEKGKNNYKAREVLFPGDGFILVFFNKNAT